MNFVYVNNLFNVMRARIAPPQPAGSADVLLDMQNFQRWQFFNNRLITALELYINRSWEGITDMLRRWRDRAMHNAFKPGGRGYLRARLDYLVNSGQTRATRRYRPY